VSKVVQVVVVLDCFPSRCDPAAWIDHLSGDPSLFAQRLRASMALMRALRDPGGTPTVRLHYELRSARLQGASEEAAVKASPNVTKFPRPPKLDRK
jgi:hypothetical protein